MASKCMASDMKPQQVSLEIFLHFIRNTDNVFFCSYRFMIYFEEHSKHETQQEFQWKELIRNKDYSSGSIQLCSLVIHTFCRNLVSIINIIRTYLFRWIWRLFIASKSTDWLQSDSFIDINIDIRYFD